MHGLQIPSDCSQLILVVPMYGTHLNSFQTVLNYARNDEHEKKLLLHRNSHTFAVAGKLRSVHTLYAGNTIAEITGVTNI